MGTIPTPPTIVAGTSVGLAAQLNTMRDCVNFWANTPKCYAYQTAGVTLANGTVTVLPLQAELYDIVQAGDSPSHDNTTSNTRLVARTAGKYTISGTVSFASNATGDRGAYVRLNAAGVATGGTLLSTSRSAATAAGSLSVANLPTIERDLAVGDYIELFALQTAGGTLPTSATGSFDTWLSMRLSGQ